MPKPHFEGNVDTRWLVEPGEDRKMEMLSEFAFIDSKGYRWAAHRGEQVDGASIPEVVWSKVVGTPFIGDYRRASVVHDVACVRREKTSKEAHRRTEPSSSIRPCASLAPSGTSNGAFARCLPSPPRR